MRQVSSLWSHSLKPVFGAIVLAVLAASSLAQEYKLPPLAGAPQECQCRAKGQMFDLGETVCIDTGYGPRLAICGMVLNNTAWKPTEQTCPTASLPPATFSLPRNTLRYTKAAPQGGFC